MTNIDIEKVLLQCQLAVYDAAIKALVDTGKLQRDDLVAAIDAAGDSLKKRNA